MANRKTVWEETFTSLSSYFERERAANQSLRGRAAYPAVMAALATAILIIAAGFVLPLFADQFPRWDFRSPPLPAGPCGPAAGWLGWLGCC